MRRQFADMRKCVKQQIEADGRNGMAREVRSPCNDLLGLPLRTMDVAAAPHLDDVTWLVDTICVGPIGPGRPSQLEISPESSRRRHGRGHLRGLSAAPRAAKL